MHIKQIFVILPARSWKVYNWQLFLFEVRFIWVIKKSKSSLSDSNFIELIFEFLTEWQNEIQGWKKLFENSRGTINRYVKLQGKNLHNRTSNKFFHNFVRSAVNRIDSGVGELSSNGVFPHISPTTEHLQAFSTNIVIFISHPIFRHRSSVLIEDAIFIHEHSVINESTRNGNVSFYFGQFVLNSLEVRL